MSNAALMQNTKYPRVALTPSQTAAAAPGSPRPTVCDRRRSPARSTMNQPATAATSATAVPARNALIMK